MLKKLRRRFTTLLMLIIGAILVSFYFTVVCILMITITVNMRASLHEFTADDYVAQYADLSSDEEIENSMVFPLYADGVCVVNVKIDGSYEKLDIGHARVQDDVLDEVVKRVNDGDTTFGLIAEQMMFYYKNPTLNGTRIAFANASQYAKYLGQILFRGALMCVIAIVVIYIVSRFMSKIFIRPVEKAWEQQQNFIADASHELKTPLTVILANTNILELHRQSTIDEEYKWLESTQEEATHMKELVDKMLLLAKSDNMRPDNMFSSVDMSELATRLCLQFEPVAFERGAILNSDIDKDVYVYGDQTSLNQIIHILIDNSVKYAGESGEVFFSLKHISGGCRLETRNPGVLIPEEDIPHLFERFYRSDKAHTAGNGYGLGLAICKNLVEMHDAVINVQSDEKSGTVFTVDFANEKKKFKGIGHGKSSKSKKASDRK